MFTTMQIDVEIARLRDALREATRKRRRGPPRWWTEGRVETLQARIGALEEARRRGLEAG